LERVRFLTIITAAGLAAAAFGQTPSAKKAMPKTAAAKPTTKKASPARSTTAKGPISKSTVAHTPVHTATSKPAPSKTGLSKTGSSKIVSHAGTPNRLTPSAKSRKPVVVVPRRPPTQQQPTLDRYKEIQQALADKGYFRGTPDGAWGPDSADALKRFQREQNLDADGKISALSLMALGLGPQRGTASAQAIKNSDIAGSPVSIDPPPVAQPQP
jgi:hypothetical protein